jgi:hypothetical protein
MPELGSRPESAPAIVSGRVEKAPTFASAAPIPLRVSRIRAGLSPS